MVIEPADEYLLIAQFFECVILLVLLLQHHDFRVLLQVDVIGEVNLTYIQGTLMSCQMRPNTMCSRFSMMNSDLRLMTVHPMDLAEEIAKFKFSILW